MQERDGVEVIGFTVSLPAFRVRFALDVQFQYARGLVYACVHASIAYMDTNAWTLKWLRELVPRSPLKSTTLLDATPQIGVRTERIKLRTSVDDICVPACQQPNQGVNPSKKSTQVRSGYFFGGGHDLRVSALKLSIVDVYTLFPRILSNQ